jgi:hypothetical protein
VSREKMGYQHGRTPNGNSGGGGAPCPSEGVAGKLSDGRFLGLPTGLLDLWTEPAGSPSLRGRPTGRLSFGGAFGSISFFPLPLGRPGVRLTGVAVKGFSAAGPFSTVEVA